jgi:hypothetical protein
VSFEFFRSGVTKIQVFWDVMQCLWVNKNTVELHLSGLIGTASYSDMQKSG